MSTDAEGTPVHLYAEVIRKTAVDALPTGAHRSSLPRGVVLLIVDDSRVWVRWPATTKTELLATSEVITYPPGQPARPR